MEISKTEFDAAALMRKGMRARATKAREAALLVRRGFVVPPDRFEEYLSLRRKVHASAKETAIIMGILPK